MGILIGMDEAGYGPNFGPLVVTATVWQCADNPDSAQTAVAKRRKTKATTSSGGCAVAEIEPTADSRQSVAEPPDLYRLLRAIVSKTASERRLAIADSKTLYTPGLGLRQLERGLHAVLLAMQQSLTSWSAIVEYCNADPDGHHKKTCWPDGHDCPLPVDAAADEVSRLEARFTRACKAADVRPLYVRARLVFPGEFNELVEHYGTKGAALSHITVGLLRNVVDKVIADHGPRSSVFALCDKHGGRNFYIALLQHHFSEHWIEPVYESHTESRYAWGPPESRTRVSFRMQGERFLPTALASMTAKYLRELSMRAFNEFWSARVPDLRPTAGYPKDSQRFRKAIATAQKELKIDDHVLWRNR
jgi:hypothetical protein